MKAAHGLLAFAAAAAAGAAEPAAAADASAVADLVDVTNGVCYSVATRQIAFGPTPAQDEQVMAANRLTYGVNAAILERFGRDGEGMLNRSTMGHRESGPDLVVLSVGGSLPGCKTILLSSTTGSVADEAAQAFAASTLGWREALAPTQSGPLLKRSFVRRDSEGLPYLLNMFTVTIPNSQIRLFTTVNPIPPNVELPEGF